MIVDCYLFSYFPDITSMSHSYTIPYSPWEDDYPKKVTSLSIDMKSLVYETPSRSLDHITCPICKHPFLKPYSTICGHTFCKACINESFKSVLGEKCPLDRVPLNVNDEAEVYPAPIILTNITDDLIVKCVNSEDGCTWRGERWSVRNHVLEKCAYTRIKCTCGLFCSRRMLLENKLITEDFHPVDRDGIAVCPHTKVSCEKCAVEVMFCEMDEHLQKHCTNNIVKCSGCHLSFPQMHLGNHTLNCQQIYVDCPGSKYGCTWKGQRELLTSIHMSDCVFLKLKGSLEQFEGRLTSLATENENLKLQMSTILDSVVQGKVQNLGYPLEIEEISGNLEVEKEYELDPVRLSMKNIRALVKELETNKNMTQLLAEENVALREQVKNQWTMIVQLQNQVQFMMIERRRQFASSGDLERLHTKL